MIQVEQLCAYAFPSPVPSIHSNSQQILHNLTFTLKKGESVAIVGPNGAGKSTLLRHLAGLSKPASGVVLYKGKPVHLLSPKERAATMALLLQSPEIAFHFTALEVVRMARYPFLRRFQPENKRDGEIVKEMMMKTDTWHLRDRTLQEMSGGERQRVFLARALAQEPEVLWLDEPTTFLDIYHQHELLGRLHAAKQQMDLTWVAVLHDLNLAVQYCDRVLLLAEGRIVADGRPREVLHAYVLQEVYGVHVTVVEAEGLPFPQFLFTSQHRE